MRVRQVFFRILTTILVLFTIWEEIPCISSSVVKIFFFALDKFYSVVTRVQGN